jgi:dTMP kinase
MATVAMTRTLTAKPTITLPGPAKPEAIKLPRGRFITFEGGEGTGKSTQARLLAARLEHEGITTVLTREPGGSPFAEELREAILSGAAAPVGPAGEALLFSAARVDHLDQTIRPALDHGAWVICDRFADSTRAYQGAGGNLDLEMIRALERVVVGSTRPELTLILDMPVEKGLARARARRGSAAGPDRFEGEGEAFHGALRQAFLDIARSEPGRCVVINADAPQADVERAIWVRVRERLLAGPHVKAGL